MSNELEGRVRLLKTIADATRLRILGLLAAQPHTGRELADALGLSAPTVSHHMHRMVEVGVVIATPDATRRVYTLNDALLAEVRASTGSADVIDDPEHQRAVRIFFDGPRLICRPFCQGGVTKWRPPGWGTPLRFWHGAW